jgi:uncharacterized protein
MAERGKRRLPYVIRRSGIQGRGAFATRLIRKGERIVEYRGEVITPEEADRRYPWDDDERHHTFLFTVDDERVIDGAFKGNSSKYLNHSCDPNCEAFIEDDGSVWIWAKRTIREGQELTFDYHYILEEPHNAANRKLYPCHCGAKDCRGTILARKKRRSAAD